MAFQATPIPGGFFSVYDTANGKTYFIESSLWTHSATETQKQCADLSEFILSAAGDWVKKPSVLRTHDILAGFIAHRAGAVSAAAIPQNVRDALAALVAAVG